MSPDRVIQAGESGIQCIDPLDHPLYDKAVAACPEASFFHLSVWARVLRDTYGFRPVCFLRSSASGSYDILPLMEVDSVLTGRRGVSLPFTDVCPPLCGSRESFEQLIRAVWLHAENRRWKSCEFRGGRNWFRDATASTAYHGHTIDLRGDAAALFSRVDGATRRAVRKAEKSGVVVTFGHNLDSVQTFYALHCKTRRKHGLPPQPFRFFASIHQHILAPQKGCVVLAHHGDAPIAGAIYFHAGKTALYKFGASDESHQQVRGNNLVMWRALEWHARMGFESMDLGRTSLGNEGLRNYKLSWGATEHRIEYVKFDRRRQIFVSEPDRASGWQNRVFRLLPDTLSRLAGALLYRHVA